MTDQQSSVHLRSSSGALKIMNRMSKRAPRFKDKFERELDAKRKLLVCLQVLRSYLVLLWQIHDPQ